MDFFDDVRVYFVTDRVRRYENGIFYRPCGAGTMPDNADSIDSQQGTSTIRFVIAALECGFEGAFGHQGAQLPEGRAVEFQLEPFEHHFGGRLAAFQHDVSGEPVADPNIKRSLEQVVPFDIAAAVMAIGALVVGLRTSQPTEQRSPQS